MVTVYRHLGGIVTSNSSPAPDLYHRYARADGTARPLKHSFFGSRRFSIEVRRALLQALAVSKYVHTGAALLLHHACHLRLWERHYVSLWRNLSRRVAPADQDHPYLVLLRAKASAPPLALARARASLLTKIFSRGPLLLAAFLVDHFLLHPASSWLQQLKSDVDFVVQYLPSVRNVLPSGAEVASLLEAVGAKPKWWLQTIRKVEKLYQHDLQAWSDAPASDSAKPTSCVRPPDAGAHVMPPAFICKHCAKAFVLRKHLHLHLAKTHGFLSPARHFAISDTCTACGKFFGSVAQVQQHLKQQHRCLRRCCALHAPLTKAQIAALEAPAKKSAKTVKAGAWRSYVGGPPPSLAPLTAGPLLPTAAERSQGLPAGEAVLLGPTSRRQRRSLGSKTILRASPRRVPELPQLGSGSAGPQRSTRRSRRLTRMPIISQFWTRPNEGSDVRTRTRNTTADGQNPAVPIIRNIP